MKKFFACAALLLLGTSAAKAQLNAYFVNVGQGDAEGSVEQALMNICKSGLQSTYLKVAHHGSRCSPTEKFLERVQPRGRPSPAAPATSTATRTRRRSTACARPGPRSAPPSTAPSR